MAMTGFSDGFWVQIIFLLARQVNFPIQPSLALSASLNPSQVLLQNLQFINMAMLALDELQRSLKL